MSGFNTLWLPGTDHAGIATQMVVDRELPKRGISALRPGREKFVEEVWKWKEQHRTEIKRPVGPARRLRRLDAPNASPSTRTLARRSPRLRPPVRRRF